MVHKPEEANSDEGAEIGEELWAVDLHGCSQAAAKLLLHNGWVWDVVLAERQLPKKKKNQLHIRPYSFSAACHLQYTASATYWSGGFTEHTN